MAKQAKTADRYAARLSKVRVRGAATDADPAMRRLYLLSEIQRISEPSRVARARCQRLHRRMERLETKAATAVQDPKGAASRRDLLAALSEWAKQSFFDYCRETKAVRDEFKAHSEEVTALWDELRALATPSAREANRSVFGPDLDQEHNHSSTEGAWVRDPDSGELVWAMVKVRDTDRDDD